MSQCVYSVFTELMLLGLPCCAGTSETDNLEEGIELLLAVVSWILLHDLLTPQSQGLWQSGRFRREHQKEQKLFALTLENNSRMVRIWGLIVPTKNRFLTTRFLSQKLTLILRFHLHLVIPQTGGQALGL